VNDGRPTIRSLISARRSPALHYTKMRIENLFLVHPGIFPCFAPPDSATYRREHFRKPCSLPRFRKRQRMVRAVSLSKTMARRPQDAAEPLLSLSPNKLSRRVSLALLIPEVSEFRSQKNVSAALGPRTGAHRAPMTDSAPLATIFNRQVHVWVSVQTTSHLIGYTAQLKVTRLAICGN
jgi:hypothetical protein